MYFEKRLGVKMAANLKRRRSLVYPWKEQKGICPVCQQAITQLTGCITITFSGAHMAEVIRWITVFCFTRNCHWQVHNQERRL